jgi:hypothetical protein
MKETSNVATEFLGFLGQGEVPCSWPHGYFLSIRDKDKGTYVLSCECSMEGKHKQVHQGDSPEALAAYFRQKGLAWDDAYMEMRRFAPDFAARFRRAADDSPPHGAPRMTRTAI